jgi:hypothetical protein
MIQMKRKGFIKKETGIERNGNDGLKCPYLTNQLSVVLDALQVTVKGAD